MRRELLFLTLILPTGLIGCHQSPDAHDPGVVSHPVFAKLKDPAEAPALIADCDARIGTLPMVASYACGVPLDLGRAEVVADYDVGMFVSFATVEDYRAYLVHPDHVWLVEKWRPRMEWLRIYDIADQTR